MFELVVALVGIGVVAVLFALSQSEQRSYLDYLHLRTMNRQANRLQTKGKR